MNWAEHKTIHKLKNDFPELIKEIKKNKMHSLWLEKGFQPMIAFNVTGDYFLPLIGESRSKYQIFSSLSGMEAKS